MAVAALKLQWLSHYCMCCHGTHFYVQIWVSLGCHRICLLRHCRFSATLLHILHVQILQSCVSQWSHHHVSLSLYDCQFQWICVPSACSHSNARWLVGSHECLCMSQIWCTGQDSSHMLWCLADMLCKHISSIYMWGRGVDGPLEQGSGTTCSF